MNLAKLIVMSAPSGAGKTTLCRMLQKEFPSLAISVSCTTRTPRPDEIEGISYHFLTEQQFKVKIQNNEFAEWASVHENYYGTLRRTIEDFFRAGQSVLLDIDVQGAQALRKVYSRQIITIFIVPPSLEILRQRLSKRATDNPAVIENRVKNAVKELSHRDEFDHVIVNDNLPQAYDQLRAIIHSILQSDSQSGAQSASPPPSESPQGK